MELTGELREVISPHAFTLGGDRPGENPVLVVARTVPDDLLPGMTVQVGGTVKTFEIAGYEADLDLDLEDGEYRDFDQEPAVLANTVDVT